jgi:hypothetical protein
MVVSLSMQQNPEIKTAPEGAVLFNPECSVLAVADVHRYFKTKTHFGYFGLGPHGALLVFSYQFKRFA